ncbi:MAG: CHC2 zinc finger domain-containing protein [Terrimicrobiaceae bacterium]
MSRSERRAERIRQEVPIEALLAHYGYQVVAGADREQQFPCDLHGDGSDGKPSARCYPENNSWFCFGCNRSRDAIQTVREKEGLSFYLTLQRLEQLFSLPNLAWEDGDREEAPKDPLEGIFSQQEATFADAANRADRILKSMVLERRHPLPTILRLYEEYDRLVSFSETDADGVMGDMVALVGRLKVLAS